MPRVFPDVLSQIFIVCSTLFGLLLPALVLTRIADGPDAYRRLWRSILKVDVSSGWYAFALLAIPIIAIALALMFVGARDQDTSFVGALVAGFFVIVSVGFRVVNGLDVQQDWQFVPRRADPRSDQRGDRRQRSVWRRFHPNNVAGRGLRRRASPSGITTDRYHGNDRYAWSPRT